MIFFGQNRIELKLCYQLLGVHGPVKLSTIRNHNRDRNYTKYDFKTFTGTFRIMDKFAKKKAESYRYS